MTDEEKKAKEKAEREREDAKKMKAKESDVKQSEADDEDEAEDYDDEDECETPLPKAKKRALAKAFRRISKLSQKHKEFAANLTDEDNGDFLAMTPAERDKYIEANPDKGADDDAKTPPAVKKALAKAAADRVQLAKLLDEREATQFEKRATGLGIEPVHGETLRKAYRGDEKAIAKLETLIKSMSEQIRTGKVFAEFGSDLRGGAATAKAEFAEKVAELRKADPKLSDAKAFTKIYTDPAYSDLKKRYDAETAPRA